MHTILVIDDEPDVVKSVVDLLRLDYRVLGATGAERGLDAMRREQVHVVLSDQRMAGMTGVELFAKLRNEYPDAIRLLFTGYADMRAVVDAINQGHIYRYISKPWDSKELELIIRDACKYHDLIAERRQLLSDLEKKNAELGKSNELKTAFIRVAGHELRTPLSILVGLSKLATDERVVAEPLSWYIGGIGEATGRLDRLVSQILKMLSAERFDRVLDRQSADIGSLLKLAADDVAPFARIRNQTMEVDIAEDLGLMQIDVEKMRDSINQLLLNAIKFTADGGCIGLKARRNENGISICVSDNGSGIEPENLPCIFEPFFTRFDVSRHSSGHYEHQGRGLGLGLSVVKAFTEMHGGKVEVESQINKGSVFRVFLPVQ
jgi:signal transduction histidine kinase